MTADTLMEEALRLPAPEREALCERLWASLGAGSVTLPTDQVEELERRIAHYEAQPDDVISWNDLKAELLEKRGLKL